MQNEKTNNRGKNQIRICLMIMVSYPEDDYSEESVKCYNGIEVFRQT